jgi:hypothetical protein
MRGRAMIVTILTPPAGCWRITGTYRGQQVSYVVNVEKQPIQYPGPRAPLVKPTKRPVPRPMSPPYGPPCLISIDNACP